MKHTEGEAHHIRTCTSNMSWISVDTLQISHRSLLGPRANVVRGPDNEPLVPPMKTVIREYKSDRTHKMTYLDMQLLIDGARRYAVHRGPY